MEYINPLEVFRKHMRVPIEAFLLKQYTEYRKRTDQGISSAKEVLFRAGILAVFLTAILWISIFMYVVFYYTYMPNVTHIRPVHLQFKSCDDRLGVCSYPSAHVQLTRRSRALMAAQPYRVRLLLEMPESQVNKDLGMFMVCAQMRGKAGSLVASSCRSAMLRHSLTRKFIIAVSRSRLHELVRTLVLVPMLLLGLNDEKQHLSVELFTDFEDDQDTPATDAYVEVQSRFVQVYTCELQIEAHFSGLRYVMFHWPKVSAIVGISTNLFFVSMIFILSWYHLQDGLPDFVKKFGADVNLEDSEEEEDTKILDNLTGKLKLEREDTKILDNLTGKLKLEREDSSIFDEDSFLDDMNGGATPEINKSEPMVKVTAKIS